MVSRDKRGSGRLQGFPDEFLPWLRVQPQQTGDGAALLARTRTAGARAGPARPLTRRIRRSGFPGAPTRGCRLPGSARRWSPSSLPTPVRGWDAENSPLESGEKKKKDKLSAPKCCEGSCRRGAARGPCQPEKRRPPSTFTLWRSGDTLFKMENQNRVMFWMPGKSPAEFWNPALKGRRASTNRLQI